MSSYAAPRKRLTITTKNANEDKESTWLRLLAGLLFVAGCSCYVAGTVMNLPQIGASSDAWMYNAIGAGIFILCGLVEYCNYMGGFHIFLIFAGIFGLTAEVLDGQQSQISVYCNFLANHMYFCEAVKVYYAHSGDKYFMEIASKYIMIETLHFADMLFVLGTIIDMVLAWIYLFTGSPAGSSAPGAGDGGGSGNNSLNLLRTDTQKIVEVVSASFWFTCSVLTLIVYLRMAKIQGSFGDDEEDEEEKKSLTNLSTRV
ncbi:unnamed protein product [Cylindrotheca closterium]|uniref:Uncharacterized protein n=1 Tax=Cylindrotheca closterium TaxID=2856 RepID=A0AAD2JKF0_9STRA|nr:unnamed protein product [Cylindrotheca closterium]